MEKSPTAINEDSSLLELAKAKVAVLEELELLESEFALLQNEYHKRKEQIGRRLQLLN